MPSAHAQLLISLNGSFYRQDFNSLPTTGTVNNQGDLPQGWAFNESGSGGTITFAADNGNSSTANTYSYGLTGNTDRAFGELTGSTVNSTIGVGFINRTGFVITRLTVGYTGEQWRLGAADANTDRLDFQFSTDATSITTGSWTDINTLDFLSPNNAGATGAKDGNNAANRTVFPGTAINATIPSEGVFWVRWTSTDITGNDDGLSIDDFTLRSTPFADFDLDGDVDGADYMRLQRNFGTASGAGLSSGEANGDGAVDALDYAIWRQNFGNFSQGSNGGAGAGSGSGSGAEAVEGVPEPTSLVMVVLGVVGVFAARRVRNRSTRVAVVMAVLFLGADLARAQNVSLSLNVFPTTVAAPNSGGTWTLVAKTTSTFGISSVDSHMTGISASGISYGPGINATLDGGNPFVTSGSPVNLLYFQDVTAPGLVLGVGTATFSQAQPDPFGDPVWNAATKIAMGTYSSTVPAFVTSGTNVTDASLFTSNSTPANGIADANTTFVVRVVAAIAGDYNTNGIVDAADYALWRERNGTNTVLQNDNGLGTPIGQSHYNLWRSRFGLNSGAASGAGSFAAVPEPAAGVSLILALAGCSLMMKKRGHSRWREPCTLY